MQADTVVRLFDAAIARKTDLTLFLKNNSEVSIFPVLYKRTAPTEFEVGIDQLYTATRSMPGNPDTPVSLTRTHTFVFDATDVAAIKLMDPPA